MLVEAASKLKITPRWLQSECIKTFGITYSTLYRLIKAHAGISLIIKNNYSWRQIAELLKYSAEANLTRDFKKVFGLTPTEIKEYLYQTNIDINNLSFIDLKKI